VVEWGFAIVDFDAELVHKLRGMGFDAWWVDGDEPTCHQRYLTVRCAARCSRIIDTVTSGPTGLEYRTPEQIVSVMLPDDAEGGSTFRTCRGVCRVSTTSA
jgi:hypothetical protein